MFAFVIKVTLNIMNIFIPADLQPPVPTANNNVEAKDFANLHVKVIRGSFPGPVHFSLFIRAQSRQECLRWFH